MPIWSLTSERLEKLKEAIRKKKAEHDELLALSEKDLWCNDLDEFQVEWDNQLALDAEIQTNIRRMGRRVSKKIGAGRSRKPKDEDDYEPDKKGKGKAKAAPKVETKSSQRFAEMFSAKPKVKKEAQPDVMELSDNHFSDDDFAALSRSKPAPKTAEVRSSSQAQSQPPSQSEEPDAGRNKRAAASAASKARTFLDADSDSDDDDKMLGDVGALVKGIGKPAGDSSGRLSLYAMNRPESSHGNNALPKMKSKSSKTFDLDSPDDTNYEMLAKSSPHKTATKDDLVDELLSDDEPAPAPAKTAAPKVPAGLSQVKKPRGRPAGSKAKPKEEPKAKAVPKAAAKSSTLSPAAKAYAAKRGVKASALMDDSDDDLADPDSPPPKAAGRGRPGRAAAARRPIVVDDDSSMMADEQDESEDPFEVDDDDD